MKIVIEKGVTGATERARLSCLEEASTSKNFDVIRTDSDNNKERNMLNCIPR